MPVSIPVNPSTPQIKYRGLCDLQGLLIMMRRWMVDYGYTFNEDAYKHKAKEIELKWSGTKNINNFIQFQINLYFHVWDRKDVDVVKAGEKKTLQQVRMLIEFSGIMNLDYKKSFEKTRFLLAIRDFLRKYIWWKKITGGWGDELYYTIYKLHRMTKEHLGMETPTFAHKYWV